MADGVLGLGGGGASSLNQELIDKLKAAEKKARVDPLEKKEDDWETESAKMMEIKAANLELIDAFKAFSLDNKTNSFAQKVATTTGTSVEYDVDDPSSLVEGTTNVTISQLAQRDVYQTGTFSNSEDLIAGGQDDGDKITINGVDFSTVGKSYEDLATDINLNENFTASVEQVGDSSYRIIIKSAEAGKDNALDITQSGVSLGIDAQQKSAAVSSTGSLIAGGQDDGDKITIDGVDFSTVNKSYEDLANDIDANDDFNASIVDGQIVVTRADGSDISITQTGVDLGFSSAVIRAQNLHATIDGVSYDTSSNTITTQGSLRITANSLGDSSITIREDTSSIATNAHTLVDKYNAFINLVDGELNSDTSTISDKSSLRMMVTSMKDMLYANYGENDDLNLFNFGFSVDKSGNLSIDDAKLSESVTNNYDDLKALFVGTQEQKGLGTLLTTYTDNLDGYDGLLTQYDDSMTTRKKVLDDDLKKAQDDLDSKYDLMAKQFADYGVIISQMEAQFSSLKMTIDQSTSSK
jgi:flagellar hook-associated protein 2